MIMSDFETAALSAVHIVGPNAILDGCFYHLSQCVYRQVQEEGLAQLYSDDDKDEDKDVTSTGICTSSCCCKCIRKSATEFTS